MRTVLVVLLIAGCGGDPAAPSPASLTDASLQSDVAGSVTDGEPQMDAGRIIADGAGTGYIGDPCNSMADCAQDTGAGPLDCLQESDARRCRQCGFNGLRCCSMDSCDAHASCIDEGGTHMCRSCGYFGASCCTVPTLPDTSYINGGYCRSNLGCSPQGKCN